MPIADELVGRKRCQYAGHGALTIMLALYVDYCIQVNIIISHCPYNCAQTYQTHVSVSPTVVHNNCAHISHFSFHIKYKRLFRGLEVFQ